MHACTIPEGALFTSCSLKSTVPFLFLPSLFPSVPPDPAFVTPYVGRDLPLVSSVPFSSSCFHITLKFQIMTPDSKEPANSTNPAAGGPCAPPDGGRKGGVLRFRLSSFTPHTEHPVCLLHR